jgi:hypothetical protein
MRCRDPERAPPARAVPAGTQRSAAARDSAGPHHGPDWQAASRTLEIDARLQHVAEMHVPQLADHRFIDLFQGDALVCRVRRHASGWTPPPGTWKQVGERMRS